MPLDPGGALDLLVAILKAPCKRGRGPVARKEGHGLVCTRPSCKVTFAECAWSPRQPYGKQGRLKADAGGGDARRPGKAGQ